MFTAFSGKMNTLNEYFNFPLKFPKSVNLQIHQLNLMIYFNCQQLAAEAQ